MPKILLCRASPRCNIEEVEHYNNILPCDRFLVCFKNEFEAYAQMRDYFLAHNQYEYMVLATDDIVVKPEHIEQLMRDLDEGDYPVLGGMMNVEQTDTENVNLTWILPMTDRGAREYRWLKRSELPQENIFQVSFNGFALLAIRRDIVEDYIFNTDAIFRDGEKNLAFGASLDFVFCHWCNQKGIKIYTDKRIDMKHLRNEGKNQCGLRPPEWWSMRSYSSKKYRDDSGAMYRLLKERERYIEKGKFSHEDHNRIVDAILDAILNP